MACQEKSRFCTGQDVRLVQMKSKRVGPGGNVYNGVIKMMCSVCRSYQNGQFKYVK
jgi:hypothetical protein